MKKIISLVLTLALMAIPFCCMSFTASAASENLIVNGDFSDGFNGWTVLDQPAGSTSVGETRIHQGWGDFLQTAPFLCMQDYDSGVKQDVPLTAGIYQLSYKHARNDATSNLIVLVSDGKGNNFLEYAKDITNHSKFATDTITFAVNEDAPDAFIRLSSEKAAPQVFVDDIVLTKTEISDERIVNGDFSNGETGWKRLGNTLITVGDTGAANLRYWSNKDTGFEQDGIVLLKGEAFDFAFDSYNVGSGTRTVIARIVSGDTVIATKTITVNSTNSKAFSLRFIADATYENARVHFYAPSSEGQGTMIDNVSLKKIDTNGELVYNGQFALRDGKVGWNVSNVTITPSDSVKFLWESNPTISTEVILEKGRSYKLNYEWFSDRVHSMSVSVSMGDATVLSKSWDTYATGGKYVGKSYEFIAEKTGLATLTFTTTNGYNATKIKNISLVATTPKSAERIVNGGFDTADNWKIYYDTSIIDAASDYAEGDKLGDKGIKIDNYAGGFEQSFTVVKGTQYKLSFLWAPRIYGGKKSSVRVSIADSSFGGNYNSSLDFMFNKTISSQNYNYEKYSAIFTADKTGTVVLRFDRMSLASDSIVIDDVSVKEFNLNYNVDFNNDSITMDENYICGATDIESVLSSFTLFNATVECNSQVMRTGAKIVVKVDGAEYMTRELVLSGDVNGDAVCNVLDLVAVKKQASGIDRLSGAFLKAASFNDDGVVNADDLSVIRQFIMK